MARKSVTFSQEQCVEFERAADPHQWLLSADNLHEQAKALFSRRGGARLTRHEPGKPSITWDGTNRSTFLLAAFALESAIKSLLVYEHPDWVRDGRLAKEICSHKLTQLAEQSSHVPYKARDHWVLEAFETGNESWMRYPCGRWADDIDPELELNDKLWNGYRRVMRGYGRKIMKLLGRGWAGPHGSFGRWETTGSWLD